MLLTLLQFFATKFLVLALHLEAGSFPKPLSAREEVETFAALRAGDPTARETLIRHNLRLVVHVAKKYYAQPSDQEDLISIGTIGLMKAVDTFDSTRKARFSTYASRCIENELRMYFRRERKNGGTVSLQETLEAGKDDTALTLSDVLQDGFCMEDRCEQQDEARRLRQLIEGLPARGGNRKRHRKSELLCRSSYFKISAWSLSSSSKLYRRFSASTSSFFESRGGRPRAFSRAYFRSALPGVPESFQLYRSV